MTYTRHGHHIPGTTVDDEHGQIYRARCGGVILCSVCQKDAIPVIANLEGVSKFDVFLQDHFTAVDQFDGDIDQIFKKMRLFAVGSWNNQIEDETQEISINDLEIISFTYILGGYKVWLYLKSKPGGLTIQFEVTFNVAKQEHYVGTYQKIANDTFSEDGGEPDAKLDHQA